MASQAESKPLKIVNKLLDQLSTVQSDNAEEEEHKSNTNVHKYSTQLSVLPDIQRFDRVICVLGQNPSMVTLQGTNTYIVGTGKKRFLIDTGDGRADYIPVLQRAMKENNVDGFQAIICTHQHHDHIDGIPSVRKTFGEDIPIYKYESQSVDHSLKLKFERIIDKQMFQCEGATLIAHYAPGHCDDHIVLELKEEKAVFTGDCILGEGSSVFDDLFLYMRSLQKLLTFECDVMYAGHGPKINDARKKLNFYIQHRNEREQQIVEALKQLDHNNDGVTADAVCDVVYSQTPKSLKQAALSNLKHHLHKLVMEKKVVKAEQEKYSLLK